MNGVEESAMYGHLHRKKSESACKIDHTHQQTKTQNIIAVCLNSL